MPKLTPALLMAASRELQQPNNDKWAALLVVASHELQQLNNNQSAALPGVDNKEPQKLDTSQEVNMALNFLMKDHINMVIRSPNALETLEKLTKKFPYIPDYFGKDGLTEKGKLSLEQCQHKPSGINAIDKRLQKAIKQPINTPNRLHPYKGRSCR